MVADQILPVGLSTPVGWCFFFLLEHALSFFVFSLWFGSRFNTYCSSTGISFSDHYGWLADRSCFFRSDLVRHGLRLEASCPLLDPMMGPTTSGEMRVIDPGPDSPEMRVRLRSRRNLNESTLHGALLGMTLPLNCVIDQGFLIF